jgi:predicted transcriptional regulator
MSKTTISFRTDEARKAALDELASSQQRDRSFLINEALDNYLDVQRWQIEHIRKGMAEADSGEFVSPEDMAETFADLSSRCR